MRLIDADAIKNIVTDFIGDVEYRDSDDYLACVCHAVRAIDDAPTIDPVKHGYWENDTFGHEGTNYGRFWTCSVCGEQCTTKDKRWRLQATISNIYPYCAKCGAKMDEVCE